MTSTNVPGGGDWEYGCMALLGELTPDVDPVVCGDQVSAFHGIAIGKSLSFRIGIMLCKPHADEIMTAQLIDSTEP
jgi:hypothetical protein